MKEGLIKQQKRKLATDYSQTESVVPQPVLAIYLRLGSTLHTEIQAIHHIKTLALA